MAKMASEKPKEKEKGHKGGEFTAFINAQADKEKEIVEGLAVEWDKAVADLKKENQIRQAWKSASNNGKKAIVSKLLQYQDQRESAGKAIPEFKKKLIAEFKAYVEKNIGGTYNGHIWIPPPPSARQIAANFYLSDRSGGYGGRSDLYKRGRERAAASLVDFDDYYYDASDAISAYQGGLDDGYYYDIVADEYDDDIHGYYDYDYDDGGYKASAKLSVYDDDNHYYDNGGRLGNYYGSKVKAKQRSNHRNWYGRRGLMEYVEDGDISRDPAALILSVTLFIGFIVLFVVIYRYKMRKKGMNITHREMEQQIINDSIGEDEEEDQV